MVDLLADRISPRFDSPSLRILVLAAVNADRRAALRKILSEIPQELAEDALYAKAKIALAVRAGNISEAEQELRSALTRDPTNLELHIQLIHALFRQGKTEEVRAAISIPAELFQGDPIDFIKLAHFKDDLGDWREAHTLAYRTLLNNQNSPSVAMGYIGIFLRPGHSREFSASVSVVQKDSAVAVKTGEGLVLVYIIEPDETLRISAQYLSSDHVVAKLLIGKKSGDTIQLPDTTEATIIWIKPKVLYRDAIVAMIDSQFYFISITSQILVSSVRGRTGHSLPESFKKLASRLGGKNADLESHASVAYQAGVVLWNDRSLTNTVREGVVGHLLDRLVDERSMAEVRAIIGSWVDLERRRVHSGSMIPYINGWLRGHFLHA